MRIKVTPPKKPEDNILPLINIVFLMLIFFLVAATLKPFAELDVTPAEAIGGIQTDNPPDTVLVDAAGKILYEGAIVTTGELTERLAIRLEQGDMPRLKILPDKALPAQRLLDVLAAATAAGARNVSLITARSAPQ